MKITVLWKQCNYYKKDLTEHSRKLAFATAAICWFFHSQQFTFPRPIFICLCLIVIFFFFDVLQSYSAALILHFWTRKQEKRVWKEKGSIDAQVNKPAWTDIPAFVLWNLKIFSLFLSFIFLAYEFIRRIFT